MNVTQYPNVSSVSGADLLWLWQGGAQQNATAAQFKTYLLGGGSLAIASSKTLTVSSSLTLAGTDGSTLNIGSGGTLASGAFASAYTLPAATNSTLGGVIVGTGLSVTSGTVSIGTSVVTLTGSQDITNKSVNGVTLAGSGTLTVGSGGTLGTGAYAPAYVLPDATTSVKGGVIIGTGLKVTSGTVSTDTAFVGKSANFTMAKGSKYSADTTSSAFNATLYASPTTADEPMEIIDAQGTFGTHNLTLIPNGTDKINGVNASVPLDLSGTRWLIAWVGGATGWRAI